MQAVPNNFPGRGGSAFAYMNETDTDYVFMLAGGASRNDQYDDIMTVKVNKESDAI